jgi:tripartite-type tricarboxylate transporter receptor subunit TctC
MRETLGRPVIVENRPGAASRLAIEAVRNAPPDGNTLLATLSGPMTLYPHIFTNLRFDVVADFTPIVQIAYSELGLSVANNVPVTTVAELRDWIKRNPSRASYGSAGSGTTLHFTGALFVQRAGLDMVHIPYKGEAPAVNDVIAGTLTMTFSTTQQVAAMHRAGRLKVLATTGSARSPLLPDVPTLKESGVDLEMSTWYGLFGPARLPDATVQAFNRAALAATRDPRLREQFQKLGLVLTGTSPAELARIQALEIAAWEQTVKSTGFKPEE